MLRLHQVRCYSAKQCLAEVDQIELHAKHFFALLGPNGAGKTSLLKAISGDANYTGKAEFHGKALSHWLPLDRARHLGVLPQNSTLNFPFSAAEVVAMGLTPLSLTRQEGNQQIKLKMQQTHCAHLADQPYPSLSGGEKQRVHLARVLLQVSQAEQAPLLLLDEPTSAQDLGQQHQILELIKNLCHQQEYGVLAILHDLNQVLRYCDSCGVMWQGKLDAKGPPEEVLVAETIQRYWQYQPQIISGEQHKVIV